MEKELIVKVIYNETKLKHSIQYQESQPAIFFDLKKQIYEQLKKLNAIQTEQISQIQIADVDGFLFNDSNQIHLFVQNNDIINVKFIPLQENKCDQPTTTQPQTSQTEKKQADPKEAICVVYDTSGSMGDNFFQDQQLSRIGAVNSWFSAFADKTLVFEFNHVVQLICFSSIVNVRCQFNNDFENFIKLVDDVKAAGCTKLYDAIAQSIINLLEIKKKYPKIILRIIALTDGEDNESTHTAQNLVKQIIENRIIIDSFVVGENCQGLKTLTHASGGRCYCPKELNQGMQLFEIETILSVEARDIGKEGFDPNINLETLKNKPFDLEGIKQSQKQLLVQVEKPEVIIKQMQDEDKKQQNLGVQPAITANSGAIRRVFKEMSDFINSPIENVKIFPSKDNILFWKALMIGPKGTSYNLGAYVVSIQFPNEYPFRPPKFAFLTQIYHCNVSQQGQLCLDILRDSWSPAFTISKVFSAVLNLIQNPNPSDAINSDVASFMIHEKEKFHEKVIQETLKFANQDSGTLVQQILGGDLNSMNLDEFQTLKDELSVWIKENRA